MEYLLGGCTGLLKEAETTNRSLLRLCLVDDQSLDKGITSLCWSGGFGGYSEDEITVGYKDGSLISYNYLNMKINREYKLDSKCIYVTMLNYHFDAFVPEIYKKNKDSPLYPESKRPNVYDTNDRLLLAVTEGGYIYVFDWSVDKDESVARVKHLTKDSVKDNKNKETEGKHTEIGGNDEKNRNAKVKKQKLKGEGSDSTTAVGGEINTDSSSKNDDEEYVGALFVYKYRGPIRDAKVHSVMKNRLVLGGTNIAPVLVDLFSETVLWVGKLPHDTVLGLQSPLDITSICILEEIDDDLICVSTRDSFVYVYDPKCQRDPVFEFNICDYRGIGLSKKSLSLLYEDFNTKHRRRLSRAINEKYSQNDRTILRLATRPSYTLDFVDTNSHNDSATVTNGLDSLDISDVTRVGANDNNNSTDGNDHNNSTDGKTVGSPTSGHDHYSTFKLSDSLYLRYYNAVKKDFCNLYICDNFGTIYNLQFLTGDRLVWWIYRKIHAIVDLGQLPSVGNNSSTTNKSSSNSNNSTTSTSNTSISTTNKSSNTSNNSTTSTSNVNTNNSTYDSESSETAFKGVKRPLTADDVYKLNSSDKHKIVQHLIEARKRLCSSSNNDKRVHFRRNHYSQFVCRILNCFNLHNGSIVDVKCIGDYLISASLDRYSNIVNVKTGKLVFTLYCNQKQSCILVKNRYLMTTFNDQAEFKHSKSYESTGSKHNRGSHSDSEEAIDEDGHGDSDDPGDSDEDNFEDSDASEAEDPVDSEGSEGSETSESDDYGYSGSEDADDSDDDV